MNVRFNSEKTLVKASELYNNMSISKAQFYRFINKWIINGVSLAEMGKVKVGMKKNKNKTATAKALARKYINRALKKVNAKLNKKVKEQINVQ